MKTTILIHLLMALAITLGLADLGAAKEVRALLAKIGGNRLIFVGDRGEKMTVRVPDPLAIQDLKVGEKVLVIQESDSVKVFKGGGSMIKEGGVLKAAAIQEEFLTQGQLPAARVLKKLKSQWKTSISWSRWLRSFWA